MPLRAAARAVAGAIADLKELEKTRPVFLADARQVAAQWKHQGAIPESMETALDCLLVVDHALTAALLAEELGNVRIAELEERLAACQHILSDHVIIMKKAGIQ